MSAKMAILFDRTVYLEGANDSRSEGKIRGMTLQGAYVDEVTLIDRDFFTMLLSRLSEPKAKLFGSTNPDSPNHWLKTEYLDRKDDIDIYIEKYCIDDNTFLDPEYVKQIKAEYTGVFYDRFIVGDFVLAEGVIYPMYQDALEEAPNTPVDVYRVSIDYGTQNAFAALLWEKHGKVWYAVKEYYYSGRDTGLQKTDEEYGRDMDKFVDGIEGRIKCIIDPSAASFIALLRRKGGKYSVKPADNDVMDGIRETATAMITGKIKISPTKCPNLIKELQGYVWDDSADDRPVKVNDHACLSGDTIVETENGKCKIRDLVGKTGFVWSYNIEDGKPELKPFKNVMMTRRNAQIYKIELEDGRIIRCTDDHPILTTEGYKTIKHLKESDKVICID
jgi:PBSX family phage terminase large subunit